MGYRRRIALTDILISKTLSKKKPLGSEQIERFEEALYKIVRDREYIDLSVDYHPSHHLAEAVERSTIDDKQFGICGRFPFKTRMWMDNDHVSVSAGYGAEETFLFQTKRFAARRLLVERSYAYRDVWQDEQRKIIDPIVDERTAMTKKCGWNHPDVSAIQRKINELLKPFDDRADHYRKKFDSYYAAMPYIPNGKLEDIADNFWRTVVFADNRYMFMRKMRERKARKAA
jgi:hypothetical protein